MADSFNYIKNQGFTLLEVMVSLLLFSFTLLSLDALGMLTLQKTKDNYYVLIGITQLENMKERLKLPGSGIEAWNKFNKKLLPDGRGRVVCHSNQREIVLQWQHQALHLNSSPCDT